MRAIATALRRDSSQPVRILSVTGTSTAPTTASRMSRTSGSSRISDEPAARLQTFRAGQPMLMSMTSAPSSTLSRAAAASIAGSAPAICTTRGPGSPAWSSLCRDFTLSHSRVSDVIISEAASPAP